jgi:hypothetical protein
MTRREFITLLGGRRRGRSRRVRKRGGAGLCGHRMDAAMTGRA